MLIMTKIVWKPLKKPQCRNLLWSTYATTFDNLQLSPPSQVMTDCKKDSQLYSFIIILYKKYYNNREYIISGSKLGKDSLWN